MNNSAENIYNQYLEAEQFKSSIGRLGLYEQTRINERFYVGDQWHGVGCGSDRPLVRHNIIKRIGEYKIAQLGGKPLSVRYSVEGLAQNTAVRQAVKARRKKLAQAGAALFAPNDFGDDAGLMVSALNSYRKTVAERVGFEGIISEALKDAYIRGTGVVYTYFDPDIKTGLYADRIGGTPIMGDIVCECVKVENVFFGDPAVCDLQKQPYIILKEEKTVDEIAAELKRYGGTSRQLSRLKDQKNEKQILLTKLFKIKEADGVTRVYATRVTEKDIIRPPFYIGISVYPISVFSWEQRDRNIYGDSEITYLIPNQIAINRMITAGVWSAMSSGMPLMVVNGDMVPTDITNDPGQIIRAYGSPEEIESAVKFISPPDYSSGYMSAVESLIYNTLTQSGANEAALGDLDAANTSAIIELRNAASGYLLPLKNRYYRFVEDISLIWAEFFFGLYGKRGLKVRDENGEWYFPFDPDKFKSLVLTVCVSADEEVSRGEQETVTILNNLLEKGAVTPAQYLRRLPRGLVPDTELLLEELAAKEKEEAV